jgi:hypothetical protein
MSFIWKKKSSTSIVIKNMIQSSQINESRQTNLAWLQSAVVVSIFAPGLTFLPRRLSWMWLMPLSITKKKKLHGLSPRVNYTDRATDACRWSDCQLFADRGCHMVSVTDP